jgi:hypothetical protein
MRRIIGRLKRDVLQIGGHSGQISCSSVGSMSSKREQLATVERKLQVLDVSIVDALLHLEALLWRCHSIQRTLVQLPNEVPAPPPEVPERATATLTRHMEEMRQEWAMLGEIIGDLTAKIRRLSDAHYFERRSGFDRRRA